MRTLGEKPQVHLPTLIFWDVLIRVSRVLRIRAPTQHVEFLHRMMELNQNTPDDATDMLALVSEYVEVV